MEHINGFKAAVAAVVGCLTALWGWFGWLVVAWVVCMLLDYGTGTAAALRAGEWSSKVARDGLWHKLGAVVAVLVAAILAGMLARIRPITPSRMAATRTATTAPSLCHKPSLSTLDDHSPARGAAAVPVP